MRSNLSTKSRLAAHITALVLLILMLVYVSPPPPPEVPADPVITTTPPPSFPPDRRDADDVVAAGAATAGTEPAAPATETVPVMVTADPVQAILDMPRLSDPVTTVAAPVADPVAIAAADATAPADPDGTDPGAAVGEAPVAVLPPDDGEEATPDEQPPLHLADDDPTETADDTGPETELEDDPADPPAADPVPVRTEDIGTDEFPGDDDSRRDSSVDADTDAGAVDAAGITDDFESAANADDPLAGDILGITPATASETEADGEAVEPAGDDDGGLDTAETPARIQPDEGGYLVVAAADAAVPQTATTPLPETGTQVLGDGIFWIDSRHDGKTGLAGIGDIGTLILLAPAPDHPVADFAEYEPEIFAAGTDDATEASAEQFLDLVEQGAKPVVLVSLPGARGAAFFKGVYLLSRPNLDRAEAVDDTLRQIEPELIDAADDREAIIHRLRSLHLP
ncbi:MAG: hypothetical protein LIP77_03335 [Planctomycetes bacterium]|nr:hypothetical protein [Planctomycetota bacterium]